MHTDLKIDFVLPWVDGSDPEWLKQKQKYYNAKPEITDGKANADCRYRDYGLLRYWFRSIEKFTPWANKVFFITCGQKPEWLNESNPKLRLVDHRDYIPKEYLPTFQSNTIELNVFRIPDLSEHFVLFNDDLFMLHSVQPEYFFQNGLPVLPCDLGIPCWLGYNNASRVIINNNGLIKNHLNVSRLIWKNWKKCFSIRSLGLRRAFKNLIAFAVNRHIIAGSFGHLALPHLKSTLDEIWQRYPKILDITSQHKFREDDCVSHWLACAWNMVSGRFKPTTENKRGQAFYLNSKTLPGICEIIKNQSLPQISLSDPDDDDDPRGCFMEIGKALNSILPEKSSFEK